MKAALESDIQIGLEVLLDQDFAHGEGALSRAAHQFPIRQRHRRGVRLYRSRNDVRVTPCRINLSYARNAGAHGHDFRGAIRAESDPFYPSSRCSPYGESLI